MVWRKVGKIGNSGLRSAPHQCMAAESRDLTNSETPKFGEPTECLHSYFGTHFSIQELIFDMVPVNRISNRPKSRFF